MNAREIKREGGESTGAARRARAGGWASLRGGRHAVPTMARRAAPAPRIRPPRISAFRHHILCLACRSGPVSAEGGGVGGAPTRGPRAQNSAPPPPPSETWSPVRSVTGSPSTPGGEGGGGENNIQVPTCPRRNSHNQAFLGSCAFTAATTRGTLAQRTFTRGGASPAAGRFSAAR